MHNAQLANQPQFLLPLHQGVGQPALEHTTCISTYMHTTVPSSVQRVVIAGSLTEEYVLVQKKDWNRSSIEKL